MTGQLFVFPEGGEILACLSPREATVHVCRASDRERDQKTERMETNQEKREELTVTENTFS